MDFDSLRSCRWDQTLRFELALARHGCPTKTRRRAKRTVKGHCGIGYTECEDNLGKFSVGRGILLTLDADPPQRSCTSIAIYCACGTNFVVLPMMGVFVVVLYNCAPSKGHAKNSVYSETSWTSSIVGKSEDIFPQAGHNNLSSALFQGVRYSQQTVSYKPRRTSEPKWRRTST